MRHDLTVLLERHAGGHWTASALGLPAEPAPPWAAPPPERVGRFPPVSPVSAFGPEPGALVTALAAELARRSRDQEPHEIAAWRSYEGARVERVAVPVTPLDADEEPLAEVSVPFAVVTLPHARPPHAVLVPRLGLALAVEDASPARVAEEARVEVAAHLRRHPELRGLAEIQELHPALEERLETVAVELAPRTPLEVQAARRERARAEKEGPDEGARAVLDSIATDLLVEAREGRLGRAHEAEGLVATLLAFLRSSEDKAVALVGPSGAGKTAALDEALRRHAGRAAPAPVFRLSGSQIVAGMTGFGEWQERARAVCAAVHDAKGVLVVGDPHELVDGGRSVGMDLSVAQFLKGPIEQGKLRVVAETTPEGWDALERRDRGFAALFRVVRVPELDRTRTLAVLAEVARELAAAGKPGFAPDALEQLCALLARFQPYGAFPGKAVRFVRRAARERATAPGSVLSRAELVRLFARATGLPLALLADDAPLEPGWARAFLRERVKGQERAVGAVADLFARVKAGVSDPRRPLGSLLFLGPTGVGKTETAKALAELLFGSRERILRLDMSEYQDGLAAARLAGGPLGDEGELTRRIRAEPLSVVLLDEVEKADPGVLDLLLQVLGDARLTDARGRVADFRSAIVILTSNLGAELPEGSLGFGEGGGAADRFVRAAEQFFRPELVNRLDAVLPFDSLPREVVARIAHRELEKALARDGLARRGTRVEVAPALLERVLEAGFHPRHGARPLKRAIERLVVAPLGRFFAARAEAPRRVLVDASTGHGGEPRTQVRVVEGPAPARERSVFVAGGGSAAAHLSPDELLERIAVVRRSATRRLASDTVLDLRAELVVRGSPTKEQRRVQAALDGLEAARRSAEELEDLAIACRLDDDALALEGLGPEVAALERDVERAAFRVRALRFAAPDEVVVLAAPLERSHALAADVARLYGLFARERGFQASLHAEGRETVAGEAVPRWFPVEAPPAEWTREIAGRAPRATGALAVVLRGPDVAAYVWGEEGRHKHVPADKRERERFALVRTYLGGTREARERALASAHTIPDPREVRKAAQKAAAAGEAPREPETSVPAAVPPIVRVYDDRASPPATRDPRTHVAAPLPLARAHEAVESFAAALFREEEEA